MIPPFQGSRGYCFHDWLGLRPNLIYLTPLGSLRIIINSPVSILHSLFHWFFWNPVSVICIHHLPSRIFLLMHSARKLFHKLPHNRLCVPEEHERAILEVELIVDPCKPGILASLDGKHGSRLVGIDDWHPVNGG